MHDTCIWQVTELIKTKVEPNKTKALLCGPGSHPQHWGKRDPTQSKAQCRREAQWSQTGRLQCPQPAVPPAGAPAAQDTEAVPG